MDRWFFLLVGIVYLSLPGKTTADIGHHSRYNMYLSMHSLTYFSNDVYFLWLQIACSVGVMLVAMYRFLKVSEVNVATGACRKVTVVQRHSERPRRAAAPPRAASAPFSLLIPVKRVKCAAVQVSTLVLWNWT